MSVVQPKRSFVATLLRAIIPLVVLAGGIAAFVAISHWSGNESPRENPPPSAPTARVATVRSHSEGFVIEADGLVVPYREIAMSAEVAGRVVERTDVCRAGNFVQQGQLLLTIDPEDYQLEVERLNKERLQATIALDELREQVRGAESLIELAEKDLGLRTRELNRLQKLGRTAISVSDLEKAEASELAARNALVTLRNRVALLNVGQARLESARDLADIQLKKSQLDLQRTRIVAPTDGVIVADYVEQDSFVQRGTPVVTIEDTSRAEVNCKLRMEDLYWLWDHARKTHAAEPASLESPLATPANSSMAFAYDIPDLSVEVTYCLTGQRERNYTWQGRLERFDGIGLDEETRTAACRVVVDQPRQRLPADTSGPLALLRGMYVSIHIAVTPQTELLKLPETAIRPGNTVWCIRDGKLQILPVTLVTLQEQISSAGQATVHAVVAAVELESGAAESGTLSQPLHAGDLVVVSPLLFVRTGMEIQATLVAEKASR